MFKNLLKMFKNFEKILPIVGIIPASFTIEGNETIELPIITFHILTIVRNDEFFFSSGCSSLGSGRAVTFTSSVCLLLIFFFYFTEIWSENK